MSSIRANGLFDLKGKVAVVTGGAGAIGTVYGRALVEAGAAVALADLNGAAAKAQAVKLAAEGHRAKGAACFLTVTLVVWALGAPEGLAQDQGALGENAATGSAAGVPAEPARTGESPAEQGQAAPTEASEAPRGRMIEEIVVTAERREEQLHDVPVSMSAFDDTFLRQQGVGQLQDIAKYIPNVRFDQSGSDIEPRIRGFSTNTVVNRGLELPIGIIVDDVPYSRADYFATGLFDLDRVEVLRGPQGQLFGANTAVGLVNLTTKNPTNEYTGSIDGQLGELDSRRFEAGVGGPLSLLRGFANFRIAGLSDEQDGYLKNTTAEVLPTADPIMGGHTRRSVRGKLDFPDLAGGSLLVSYQHDRLEIGPTLRELTYVPARFRDLLRQYDPNVDAGRPSGPNWPINLVGSIDGPLGTHRSFRNADIDTVAAKGRYDLGGWGLNLVGGWSGLKSDSADDGDSAPWDAADAVVNEESAQTTGEFRVTSPDLAGFFGIGSVLGRALGSTDFTSGLFFQRRTQLPTDSVSHEDANLLVVLAGLSQLPEDQEVMVAKPPPRLEFFTTHYTQTANEYSGYGQMNWHFIDRLALIYGVRLDYTTKHATWDQVVNGQVLSNFIDSFTDEQSKDEFHFAPKVGMKADPIPDVNVYWNWSHNYQAGGFNNFSGSADPAARTVKPAEVQSWEAGTKMRLLDGAAGVNLGLFWMTMKDFQLFTVSPTPTSGGLPIARVVNVGELRARGVEADSTWLPTDWLTVRGSLGFNDATYLSFPLGTCITDRAPSDGSGVCDLAGRPLEKTPHWEASVTPSFRVPLTSIPGFGRVLPSFLSKVDLTQGVTMQYTDNRYLGDADDPRQRQPSYFNLDGNLGLGSLTQGWSVMFRVDNITDVRTGFQAFEGPPASGIIYQAPSPPRLMYGGFRWEF